MNETGNQQLPAPGIVGSGNVGVRGNGSAVYLGNGVVITANHVGAGSVKFPTWAQSGTATPQSFNEFSLSSASNATCRVQNPTDTVATWGIPTNFTPTADTDLLVFKLSTTPLLPAISVPALFSPPAIPPAPPILPAVDNVTLIATGRVYNGANTGPSADRPDVDVANTNPVRWGTNDVNSYLWATSSTANGNVYSFVTSYDNVGGTESQAQAGDSGGAVFWGNSLAGIIHAIGNEPPLPQTATTGVTQTQPADATFIASLAHYYDYGADDRRSISHCINSVTAVPEPSATAMLGLTIILATGLRWCRARSRFCSAA